MTTVLLATDADHVFDDVDAAIASDDVDVLRVRKGAEVLAAVQAIDPDLVILDLQIGNMGGVAACLALRQEEGAGRLARRPIALLMDRSADTILGHQAEADGWLVKPLDSLRLSRLTTTLLGGGKHQEAPTATG